MTFGFEPHGHALTSPSNLSRIRCSGPGGELRALVKMDHDAWADVFHDIGIAVLTVGAAAGYSGDIVDSVFGIVGGFALIRIAHSIRKGKKED